MITLLKKAAIKSLSSILLTMVTEEVMKRVVIEVLKGIAKKTENKIDDRIVEELEKQLG